VKKSVSILVFCLILVFLLRCKKDLIVSSIDQIPGTWRWEYTCGGVNDSCIYGSKANYATIEFRSDGKYIEKRNDTLYLQANYTLINTDYTFGSLILDNPSVSLPITIMDNLLLISRGNYLDTYKKIK
jgi:hypothetical protein